MGSFYDLLKKRRAVRSYTGERVPRETLERIARAARRGPNAGYSQGLRLLVVDDPEVIEALIDPEGDEGSQRWFRTAAAHIFVLTREQDYHDRYTKPDKLAATGAAGVCGPSRSGTSTRAPRSCSCGSPPSTRASARASTVCRSRRTPACASCWGFPTTSRS